MKMTKTEQKYLINYTWREIDNFQDKDHKVLVIPCGAIEQHGYHLPLSTDYIIADYIVNSVAQRCDNVYILPSMQMGLCVDTISYPGTVHLRAETIIDLVCDIIESYVNAGFSRFVLYNIHGGNKSIMDVAARETVMRLSSTYSPREKLEIFPFNGFEAVMGEIGKMVEGKSWGHACEIETSIMQVLQPHLVRMDKAVEEYMDGFESTVWKIRDMRSSSVSGVHGDSRKATPEKGRKALKMLENNFFSFLQQI